MHIFLLGFMGSGKSSVGKALAQDLKMPFYDMDSLIEAREEKSISDIFSQHGDAYFRRLETQLLKELAVYPESIIASGGGIVLNKENINLMKSQGRCVVLQASLSTLETRLKSEVAHRPLLAHPDWKTKLRVLYDERAPIYARFPLQIDTDGRSVAEIVAALKESLPQQE